MQRIGRFPTGADIKWQAGPTGSVENDPVTDVAHLGWVGQTLQSNFAGFTSPCSRVSRKHPHRFGGANSPATVDLLPDWSKMETMTFHYFYFL
jgi:hypothetical protein